MSEINRVVTLSGECLEMEFKGEVWDGQRGGTAHLFLLEDMRKGRGLRPVSLFASDQIKTLNPKYGAQVEVSRINIIRRAFDSGELSFDVPFDGDTYKSVDIRDSDFQPQPKATDADIRKFMMCRAYWLGYMHPLQPNTPIDFGKAEDVDYLGCTRTDILRNVARLQSQGMLERVMEAFGRATEQLIAAYEPNEVQQGALEGRDTLQEMPNSQPLTHRGLSVFISHSSKDAELALALIELLKDGLGLHADQIRCSSVDGYRLPVGVKTEAELRDEVNAAKVVVALLTLSSLASAYVMFELGARWGANAFLAPVLAGVKPSELSGPLSLLNALSANNESQLHQLIANIATKLDIRLQPVASYNRKIEPVKALAEALERSRKVQGVEPVARGTNLRLIRARKTKLGFVSSNEGHEHFIEEDSDKSVFGFLACIKNETEYGKIVVTAYNIRAELIFRNASGEEIGTGVPRAAWVNEETDIVDVEAGGSKYVLLFVVANSAGPVTVFWKSRRTSMYGDQIKSQIFEITEQLKTVEVRIIGEDSHQLIKPSIIEVVEGGSLAQTEVKLQG